MNKMHYITSPSNTKIKDIKSLYRKKDRWDNRLFIIEGIKIVEECIDNNYPLENIIFSEELLNIKGGNRLFNKIKDYENLINIPLKLFKEISDTENPQWIMATAKFRENYIEEVYDLNNPILLLLEEIQDPGNMGTIIRTADAFNIDGIIITTGSVDIYNPKVVRSTMGSIFRTPIYHISNKLETVERLKNCGYKIYSTSLEAKKYIQEIDFNKGSVILIGNESQGISKEISSLANELIKIPIPGNAESLNASIASSIIMYEAMRQRI